MASPSHAKETWWTGKITVPPGSIYLTPGAERVYTVKWAFPDRKHEVDEIGMCVGNTGAKPVCADYDAATDEAAKRTKRGWSVWFTVLFPADYCDEWVVGERLKMSAVALDLDRRKFQDRAFMSASIPIYCEDLR